MVVLDVSVLVYALREDTARHEAALAWLQGRLATPTELVVVPDLVWVGFAAVVTSPRVFAQPSTVPEVTAFARAVGAQPTYRRVPGLILGIEALLSAMRDGQARANLVPDAYVAAVAIQLDAELATFDKDFHRFDGLRIATL